MDKKVDRKTLARMLLRSIRWPINKKPQWDDGVVFLHRLSKPQFTDPNFFNVLSFDLADVKVAVLISDYWISAPIPLSLFTNSGEGKVCECYTETYGLFSEYIALGLGRTSLKLKVLRSNRYAPVFYYDDLNHSQDLSYNKALLDFNSFADKLVKCVIKSRLKKLTLLNFKDKHDYFKNIGAFTVSSSGFTFLLNKENIDIYGSLDNDGAFLKDVRLSPSTSIKLAKQPRDNYCDLGIDIYHVLDPVGEDVVKNRYFLKRIQNYVRKRGGYYGKHYYIRDNKTAFLGNVDDISRADAVAIKQESAFEIWLEPDLDYALYQDFTNLLMQAPLVQQGLLYLTPVDNHKSTHKYRLEITQELVNLGVSENVDGEVTPSHLKNIYRFIWRRMAHTIAGSFMDSLNPTS